MNKISFLFLSAILILLSVFAGFGSIDLSIQVYGALICIALVGIPHGAIDHILFMEERDTSPVFFYSFYFGMMIIYLVCWLVSPLWSMVFFLILSAYHFGESQFADAIRMPRFPKWSLNFAWGLSILAGMVYYNFAEIEAIAAMSDDIQPLMQGFNKQVYQVLLPVFSLSSLAMLGAAWYMQWIEAERFFTELYTLLLIHFCFFVLPLVVGFTLYFVIMHAGRVLTDEFVYLRHRRAAFSVWKFIGLLFPFTLLSIGGTALLLYAAAQAWINISNLMLVLIMISILTLPHSIVMNSFYRKLPIATNN